MGIVADIAWRPVLGDVFSVVLERVGIGKQCRTVVALVAQRIIGGALRCSVGGDVVPFQQRGPDGTMGAFGAGAASARASIVIVAIRTLHDAVDGPGRQQAGYVGVFARASDGMIGRIDGVELQTSIVLGNLARGAWRRLARTIRVATETELIFCSDLFYFGSADGCSAHTGKRTGYRP